MPYKPLALALLLLPLFGGSPLFADDAPAQTTAWPELKPSQGTAHRGEAAVVFHLPEDAAGTITFPRLDNPIQRVYWIDAPKTPLKFRQGPTEWSIQLGKRAGKRPQVVLETVGQPYLPTKPWVAEGHAKTGTIRLAAHHAIVHGEKLQYEPLPKKNTVGYWVNPKDWAEWRLASEADTYVVRILQGCGRGQGGSRAAIRVGKQSIEFDVVDTGHFQNFRWRTLGELKLPAGTHTLELRAIEKAKVAVMDCRAIELVPKAVYESEVEAESESKKEPGQN